MVETEPWFIDGGGPVASCVSLKVSPVEKGEYAIDPLKVDWECEKAMTRVDRVAYAGCISPPRLCRWKRQEFVLSLSLERQIYDRGWAGCRLWYG